MVSSTLPSARTWLGIDADAVPRRAAWVRRRRQVVEMPEPEVPADVLAARLREGTRCVAVMPSRYCLLRVLTPPDLPRRRIPRLLPGMLDIELPFPIEQCETRFLPFTDSEGFARILAIAVRHVDIDARLAQLAAQAFYPQALLPEPCVLWHYARASFADQPDTALCVVKWDHAPLHTLLAGRGGNLLWTVTAPATSADALLDLCLKTHAAEKAGPPVIRERSAVANTADPIAAALATLPPRERDLLDLRRHYCPHPAVVQTRKTAPRRLAAALCIAAAIMAASRYGVVRGTEQRAVRAQQNLQSRMDALAGYRITRRGEAALEAVRKALDERMSDAIRRQGLTPAPETLYLLLQATRETGVVIHQLQYRDGHWTVQGAGESAAIVRGLLAQLHQHQPAWTLTFTAPETAVPVPFRFQFEEIP